MLKNALATELSLPRPGPPVESDSIPLLGFETTENRSSRTRLTLPTMAITVVALVLIAFTLTSFARRPDASGVIGGCRMAYMSPSYVRLDGFGLEFSRLAGKYSTYLYREGGWDTSNQVSFP